MNAGGSLVVTTTFMGAEADDARDRFNRQSNTEIMAGNLKYYAHYYDDIKADSLTYADNDSTGLFTTQEYYTLPEFWQSKNGRSKFTFSPFIIDNMIRRPKEKNRKMPFRLSFPSSINEEVIVSLPEKWNVSDEESHLKSSGFSYNSKFFAEYNEVHRKTDFENNKDFVAADEAAAYFKALNEYDEKENYELSSVNDRQGSTNNEMSLGSKIGIFSLIILAFVAIGIRSNKRRQ